MPDALDYIDDLAPYAAVCPACGEGELMLMPKRQPNGGEYPVYFCDACDYESVESDGYDCTRIHDQESKENR